MTTTTTRILTIPTTRVGSSLEWLYLTCFDFTLFKNYYMALGENLKAHPWNKISRRLLDKVSIGIHQMFVFTHGLHQSRTIVAKEKSTPQLLWWLCGNIQKIQIKVKWFGGLISYPYFYDVSQQSIFCIYMQPTYSNHPTTAPLDSNRVVTCGYGTKRIPNLII